MKLNTYISTGVLTLFTGLSLISCESDFLQKDPITEVTKDNFFNNPQDLETYTNGFTVIFRHHIPMYFQTIYQFILVPVTQITFLEVPLHQQI